MGVRPIPGSPDLPQERPDKDKDADDVKGDCTRACPAEGEHREESKPHASCAPVATLAGGSEQSTRLRLRGSVEILYAMR
jgi:hypothetical protein